MKIYSYVIVTDSGFAPNPYWGYCTLATCKPIIRQCAQAGDWVIATGSKSGVGNGKLVYAMRVGEVLLLERYYADPMFDIKKPIAGDEFQRCGDNIYFRRNGAWKQRRNFHHKEKDMDWDLSGRNVLIAEHFYYFGNDAIDMPLEYRSLVARGRGHRCNFNPALVAEFTVWLQANFKAGIHGEPRNLLRRAQSNVRHAADREKALPSCARLVAIQVECAPADAER